jgi:hypothetical protein
MPYKDPERQRAYKREYQRKWTAAHPERERASTRKWRAAHPEWMRAMQRRQKYGVTREQQEAMLRAQNYCCAVCGDEEWTTRTGTLDLDHNHITGKVRAFLCSHCNHMIGDAKEDPERLRKAAAYLEAHP